MTALTLGLAASCAPSDPAQRDATPFTPDYLGATAEVLDTDLVRIGVTMRGARETQDVTDYADCAIAGYADARGFGFARHLRTKVTETGGLWTVDAIYTMSPALPAGTRTIDAEAQVQACAETGIPLL